MAEKRKGKKKGHSDDEDNPIEEPKPSKIEYKVADYMKKNVPTKRTKFLSHPVNFFYSNKAIDVLLDSPFATGRDPVFTTRSSVVRFCDRLLQLKFFHRAKKIAVTDKDLSVKELKKKKAKEEKQKAKEKENKKQEEEKNEDEDEDTKEDGDKKKKKKVRLDMHLEQVFVDSTDAYIWMYDPIPFWYYIAGTLLLIGAVGVCLFPLWPPSVRQGVYYLSIAAAGFLGVIIGLAILRLILFVFIWILSLGRHHLWILPNLTEDVGFFESFWPLYQYEYKGETYDDGKSKKKEKKKKIQESQKSDSEVVESLSAFETDNKPETDGERMNEESKEQSDVTDSENSNSHTFEMVNKSELENGDNTDNEEDEAAERLKKYK